MKRQVKDAAAEAELERIEAIAAAIRRHPGRFPDARAVAAHASLDRLRLGDLLLAHYHATVNDFLVRARLDLAEDRLLHGDAMAAEIAQEAGFATKEALREAFAHRNGLDPDEYRGLRSRSTFTIRLPEDYPMEPLRHALERDTQSLTERLEGDRYTTGIRLDDGARLLTMKLSPAKVVVSVEPKTKEMGRVHRMVIGLLGFGQDVDAFARLAGRRGLAKLATGCPGLRVHQTHTAYDGLLWTVIGQQINMPFAFKMRRALTEVAGEPLGNGLHTPPTPERVAALAPAELLPLQFSRQKADYVVSISRLVVEGHLDLEGMRRLSVTRVRRTLLDVRGLGVWSVNYLMMRALGFSDCLPVGDTGVTSGLQRVLELKTRPDADETLRLLGPLAPFRSLATAHLWRWSTQPAPASTSLREAKRRPART